MDSCALKKLHSVKIDILCEKYTFYAKNLHFEEIFACKIHKNVIFYTKKQFLYIKCKFLHVHMNPLIVENRLAECSYTKLVSEKLNLETNVLPSNEYNSMYIKMKCQKQTRDAIIQNWPI